MIMKTDFSYKNQEKLYLIVTFLQYMWFTAVGNIYYYNIFPVYFPLLCLQSGNYLIL